MQMQGNPIYVVDLLNLPSHIPHQTSEPYDIQSLLVKVQRIVSQFRILVFNQILVGWHAAIATRLKALEDRQSSIGIDMNPDDLVRY